MYYVIYSSISGSKFVLQGMKKLFIVFYKIFKWEYSNENLLF